MKKNFFIKKVKNPDSKASVLPPLGWENVLAQKGFAAAEKYVGEGPKFVGPVNIRRSEGMGFEGRLG